MKTKHAVSTSLGIDFPGWVAGWIARGFPSELATHRALEVHRANFPWFESLAQHLLSRTALGGASMLVAAAGNESRRDVHPRRRSSSR